MYKIQTLKGQTYSHKISFLSSKRYVINFYFYIIFYLIYPFFDEETRKYFFYRQIMKKKLQLEVIKKNVKYVQLYSQRLYEKL